MDIKLVECDARTWVDYCSFRFNRGLPPVPRPPAGLFASAGVPAGWMLAAGATLRFVSPAQPHARALMAVENLVVDADAPLRVRYNAVLVVIRSALIVATASSAALAAVPTTRSLMKMLQRAGFKPSTNEAAIWIAEPGISAPVPALRGNKKKAPASTMPAGAALTHRSSTSGQNLRGAAKRRKP